MGTDFDRAISRRLRQIRARSGWTQERLAEALEIDRATLSQYENAHFSVPLAVLSKVAGALRVRLATLVEVEEELPRRMAVAPTGRSPRKGEEASLLQEWSALRPRDRKIVLALCRFLSTEKGGSRARP